MLALVVKRGVFVTAGNSPLGSEWTFREVCSGNHLKSCDAGINSATANQVRLALHIAAFWLMHYVRSAIPQTNPLALSGRLRRKRRRSPGLPVPTLSEGRHQRIGHRAVVRIQLNQGRSPPRWDGDVIIRTDGATEWKYVFQRVPARMGRRNEMQSRSALPLAALERQWP
jgi:hypothetical protein